jgi:23S rRNA (pseudouridine1915-N3)-methyltransferase
VKVTVIAVGDVKGPLRAVVSEYESRASRYWKLELIEVDSGARGRGDAEQVKAAEQERILTRLPPSAEVVALTRTGEAIGSTELAGYLERLALYGSAGVAFVIGGAFGLGVDVLQRARRRVSLSSLTLPHELARLVLAEQLYRAGTIVRGEPYHKGSADAAGSAQL